MSRDFGGDVRLAWRRLRRSPGFALAAALTLALGIGVNTAVFGLVHATLLRPLPFPAPERLMVLWENNPMQGKARERVAAANFLDWRREARSFAALAAWAPWGMALTGTGEPRELATVRASAGLFEALGVAPTLGRGFLAEEETLGRHHVAILSHALFARRFGGDPAAVGRTITLDGSPHEIIGVMPAGFRFPDDASVALWTPLAFDGSELVSRAERRFQVLGRLASGVSPEAAAAELATVARRLGAAHPATNGGWGVTLVPAVEAAGAGSRRQLGILFAAVGCVLLLACANVAHLFLIRAADRERELAIRAALGAAPGRLARLLLVESALVAGIGCALGIGLAAWALPVLGALAPEVMPRWRDADMSTVVLLYAAGVLVVVTLLCGLAPALGSGRRDLRGSKAGRRLGPALIVGEVALSVVLLVAAGLLARSLLRVQQVNPGFEPDRVLAATIFLSGPEYDGDDAQAAFFASLVERLDALSGVQAAGAVTTLPMNPVGIDYDLPFSAEKRPPLGGGDQEQVDFRVVEGAYFQAVGVPLRRGRLFDAHDRAGSARVVVVNETLARRYFAGADPVGRQVWVGSSRGPATIVGIVGDVRHRGLTERPRPELYVPSAQYPHGGMTVVVRTAADPLALAGALTAEVYALDSDQPITDLVTLPQLLSRSVAPRRLHALLVGGFAVLALLLAAVGVYGVIAYAVGRRTREIGIRVALGAGPLQIRRAVLAPTLVLAAAGVALGALVARAAAALLRSELYEVSPLDPAAYGAAALALLLAAAVAGELPARRAVHTDPVIALRSE